MEILQCREMLKVWKGDSQRIKLICTTTQRKRIPNTRGNDNWLSRRNCWLLILSKEGLCNKKQENPENSINFIGRD